MSYGHLKEMAMLWSTVLRYDISTNNCLVPRGLGEMEIP